jgi:hypothetical protein
MPNARRDHSASTCCRFVSLETFAIPVGGPQGSDNAATSRERPSVAGFQVIMSGRFWVITEATPCQSKIQRPCRIARPGQRVLQPTTPQIDATGPSTRVAGERLDRCNDHRDRREPQRPSEQAEEEERAERHLEHAGVPGLLPARWQELRPSYGVPEIDPIPGSATVPS